MNIGLREVGLFEVQGFIARRFHDQTDPIRIVKKDGDEDIHSVLIRGGDSLAAILR